MRRFFFSLSVAVALVLASPVAAWAHDAPETNQSRWVMVDWMLESFFVFAGVAVAGFVWAWKAGHFYDLKRQALIPLGIEEEDYYTPDWALDEEEWDDVDSQR